MRTRYLALVLLVSCGSSTSVANTVEPSARPSVAISRPVKPGERLGPFAVDPLDASLGKIAIPAPGAKLTLIDFWVTWCPSSQIWFSRLEPLYQAHRADGLAMIGVSQDDASPNASPEYVLDFAKQHKATFPIAWDKDHVLAGAVHPPHWQSIVVVDRNGVVKLSHVGTHPEQITKFTEDLEALLASER